jgi:putative transposase
MMPTRIIPFINGDYYHIYNRGLEKKQIFNTTRDYNRFLDALFYYILANPKPKFSQYQQTNLHQIINNKHILDIVCYCLMPNHFHLLLRQRDDGGISEFMRKFSNSFTKYRNIKYNRQGPVFQGVFKAVGIETDEQLIHTSRYIHLNPLVSAIVKDLKYYQWSSYHTYTGTNENPLILKDSVMQFFKTSHDYENFVLDQADYGESLELLKHNKIITEDSSTPGLEPALHSRIG